MNDGTFQGGEAPTYVPGYDCTNPGAIRFDGIDDMVVLGSNDRMNRKKKKRGGKLRVTKSTL